MIKQHQKPQYFIKKQKKYRMKHIKRLNRLQDMRMKKAK